MTAITDEQVEAALFKFYAGLPLDSFPASAWDDMRAALTAAAQAGKNDLQRGQESDEAGRGTAQLSNLPDADPSRHKGASQSASVGIGERAGDTPPGPAPATPGRADDWQGKVDTAMDLYELAASPSPPTQSVEGGRQVVRALRSSADIVNEALHTALRHIEHMAIWIGKLNSGYSFESLGEDMPIIRDALADRTRELAVTTQVLGEAQTRLSQFADAYDKLKKESADRIATLTKELDEARAAPATPPAQSVEGHAPTLLTYQERLIWLLGDLMNGVENFYRAANPKRLGHINCAAARIIDEVIDPSVATLAVALTEANQKIATLTKELAEAKDAIEPFAKEAGEYSDTMPDKFAFTNTLLGHLRAARDWLERNKATGEAG